MLRYRSSGFVSMTKTPLLIVPAKWVCYVLNELLPFDTFGVPYTGLYPFSGGPTGP